MTTMKKAVDSFTVRIWMAGNYKKAEDICRKFCSRGMCVSITRMNYIYTGGEECGFCATLINYPRFPKSPDEIMTTALDLAEMLKKGLYQQSFTIESPDKTLFFSDRLEDRLQTVDEIVKNIKRTHPDDAYDIGMGLTE